MNERYRFLVRCRMTCFGGSEKGLCRCESPGACEEQNDPRYEHWRKQAEDRMGRFLGNALAARGVKVGK